MDIFNKLRKFIIGTETRPIEVEHYPVFFTTTDNKEHSFTCYRFANPKAISCTVPEYIMIDIKKDGYFRDNDGIMYPLQNVVSVKWVKDKTKTIEAEVTNNEYGWEVFYD